MSFILEPNVTSHPNKRFVQLLQYFVATSKFQNFVIVDESRRCWKTSRSRTKQHFFPPIINRNYRTRTCADRPHSLTFRDTMISLESLFRIYHWRAIGLTVFLAISPHSYGVVVVSLSVSCWTPNLCLLVDGFHIPANEFDLPFGHTSTSTLMKQFCTFRGHVLEELWGSGSDEKRKNKTKTFVIGYPWNPMPV